MAPVWKSFLRRDWLVLKTLPVAHDFSLLQQQTQIFSGCPFLLSFKLCYQEMVAMKHQNWNQYIGQQNEKHRDAHGHIPSSIFAELEPSFVRASLQGKTHHFVSLVTLLEGQNRPACEKFIALICRYRNSQDLSWNVNCCTQFVKSNLLCREDRLMNLRCGVSQGDFECFLAACPSVTDLEEAEALCAPAIIHCKKHLRRVYFYLAMRQKQHMKWEQSVGTFHAALGKEDSVSCVPDARIFHELARAHKAQGNAELSRQFNERAFAALMKNALTPKRNLTRTEWNISIEWINDLFAARKYFNAAHDLELVQQTFCFEARQAIFNQMLADLYFQRRNWNGLLEIQKNTTQKDDLRLMSELLVAAHYFLGNFQEATEVLKSSSTQAIEHPRTWRFLARCHLELGQVDRSAVCLEAYGRIATSRATLCLEWANFFYAQNDLLKAQKQFEEAEKCRASTETAFDFEQLYEQVKGRVLKL